MREQGVEVLILHDLLTETLEAPAARAWLLDNKITADEVGPILARELRAWLDGMPADQLATYLVGGILVGELPTEFTSIVRKVAEPRDWVLAPLPNQYFTRDSSFCSTAASSWPRCTGRPAARRS